VVAPRAGGDPHSNLALLSDDRFRSTPPHGGRPARSWRYTAPPWFRSTPPHGGRPCCRLIRGTASSRFRSTPPHGGRPPAHPGVDGLRRVSIHAPARGATLRHDFPLPPGHVSIHAPARGATANSMRGSSWTRSFDPRPRTGGDLRASSSLSRSKRFRSTPPHGGRPGLRADSSCVWQSFDPRPRTGGDPVSW